MKNKPLSEFWLQLKPYDKPAATDEYYLKLASGIRKILNRNTENLLIYSTPMQLDLLSLFLASWVEDVVSGTGIWKAFANTFYERNQRWIPFFDAFDLEEDKIYHYHICFLVWYFMSSMRQECFISPYFKFLGDIASDVMKFLQDKFESAPKNTTLKSYYRLDENETDFYVARDFIGTILFKTWLFHPDTFYYLIENGDEMFDEYFYHPNLPALLEEFEINCLHSTRTQLMSADGAGWAEKILGDNHPLSNAFQTMSRQLRGYFFYRGQNHDFIFLEHIAGSEKFEVKKQMTTTSN